jgi:hypothetical protein
MAFGPNDSVHASWPTAVAVQVSTWPHLDPEVHDEGNFRFWQCWFSPQRI